MATNRSTLTAQIGFEVQEELILKALSDRMLNADVEYDALYAVAMDNAELDVLLRVSHLASVKEGTYAIGFNTAALLKRIQMLAKALGREEYEAPVKSYIRPVLW